MGTNRDISNSSNSSNSSSSSSDTNISSLQCHLECSRCSRVQHPPRAISSFTCKRSSSSSGDVMGSSNRCQCSGWRQHEPQWWWKWWWSPMDAAVFSGLHQPGREETVLSYVSLRFFRPFTHLGRVGKIGPDDRSSVIVYRVLASFAKVALVSSIV